MDFVDGLKAYNLIHIQSKIMFSISIKEKRLGLNIDRVYVINCVS
jgi:hypothetical protein